MRGGSKGFARVNNSKGDDNKPDSDVCRRCGRSRPTNPDRLQITVEDYTDSTAISEEYHLCANCWETYRSELLGAVQ